MGNNPRAHRSSSDRAGGLRPEPQASQPEALIPCAWQPIETASKDGSYIIAGRFGPSQELKWVKHSRWITPDEIVSEQGWGEPEEYKAAWTDGNDEDEPCYPTHWMPLEPPNPGESK